VDGQGPKSGLISSQRPKRFDLLHLIGQDPGKTTGMARLYEGVLTTCAVPAAQVGIVLRSWLDGYPPATIGYERFVITRETARHTSQPDALHVTGVILACAEDDGRAVVVDQNMSDAKKLMNQKLRKALGWHRTGHLAIHQNDAVCQVGKVMHRVFPEAFYDLVSPHID